MVPKPSLDKIRLDKIRYTLSIVNIRYVNGHLVKRVFKFWSLLDIANMMAGKGNFLVFYDRTSGYYHASLYLDSRRFDGFEWMGKL